jgi:hypothetical protein
MISKLWYMNSDFELELGAMPAGKYRRPPSFERFNKQLASHLLWLTNPGDGLLLEEPWPDKIVEEAKARDVELISTNKPQDQSSRLFCPWGWTSSVIALGKSVGAIMRPVSPDIVARVNSKLFSHAIEVELGINLPGSDTASTFEKLKQVVAAACPGREDKWVIKNQYGVASRGRVLGQGPVIKDSLATWAKRQIAKGETLIFQPWVKVLREYGVVMNIETKGEIEILGISDLQTNLAGTGKGYLLGRPPEPHRKKELEEFAVVIGERLFKEGYTGPVGVDALEHTEGLHPLLEINARYTMGFIALAIEHQLTPQEPFFWSTK